MENKEKTINNEKNNKIEEYKKIEEYFNDRLAESSEEEKNYVINCILAITEKERIDESKKELLKYIEYTERVFKIAWRRS